MRIITYKEVTYTKIRHESDLEKSIQFFFKMDTVLRRINNVSSIPQLIEEIAKDFIVLFKASIYNFEYFEKYIPTRNFFEYIAQKEIASRGETSRTLVIYPNQMILSMVGELYYSFSSS